jgi:valyl-tRNA synthetase
LRPGGRDASSGLADRWIRSRLGEATRVAQESFDAYRLDLAAQAIYEFTWHEFCDWYLELVKPVLNSETSRRRPRSAARAAPSRKCSRPCCACCTR